MADIFDSKGEEDVFALPSPRTHGYVISDDAGLDYLFGGSGDDEEATATPLFLIEHEESPALTPVIRRRAKRKSQHRRR